MNIDTKKLDYRAEENISIDSLKEYLEYYPDTGDILWKKKTGLKGFIGKLAGSVMSGGRKRIYIFGIGLKFHRVAWALYHGKFPEQFIDHIDGNPLNNKISNLRDVSVMENAKNVKIGAKNKTGIIGVSQSKDGIFVAQIGVNNKKVRLKQTKDFFEACCARKSAERQYGYHENHGRQAIANM